MSGPGDHDAEMSPTSPTRPHWHFDDDAIDALLQALVEGRSVDPRCEPMAALARQVHLAAEELPPPAPSGELARLLRGDGTRELVAVTPLQRRRRASLAAKVAGLGVAAKVALGTSLAAASVVGAGAAGVLPGSASDAVRDAIEAVSPVEFRGHAGDSDSTDGTDSTGTTGTSGTGNFGDEVSDDATGQSDGEPGVDGPSIAEQAPGADNRPEGVDPGPAVTTPDGSPAPPAGSVPSTVPGAPANGNGDGNGGKSGTTPSTVPDLPDLSTDSSGGGSAP